MSAPFAIKKFSNSILFLFSIAYINIFLPSLSTVLMSALFSIKNFTNAILLLFLIAYINIFLPVLSVSLTFAPFSIKNLINSKSTSCFATSYIKIV